MYRKCITIWKVEKLICLMALGLLLTGCTAEKIDLEEYVTVTYKGLEGTGVPNIYFDTANLENKIFESNDINLFSAEALSISMLVSGISTKASQTSALSNGDEISVNITGVTGLEEKYKLKFTNTQQDYTVYGLSEGTVIDVFQDIEIEYNGVSGEASIRIHNETDNPFLSEVRFSADVTQSITNGQEIIVTADYNNNLAEEHCYLVESTEKSFVASGMSEYIDEFNKFDTTTFETMKQLGLDIITTRYQDQNRYYKEIQEGTSFFSSFYDMDSVEYLSKELERVYFFTPKERHSVKNSIMLCYKVVATDSAHTEPLTRYIVIYAKDFLMDSDGHINIAPSDFSFMSAISNEDSIIATCLDPNRVDFNIEEIFY